MQKSTLPSRAPFKIPALLPAVLIADREHAASVGDLNLSEGLLTNQRASCPKTLPPLVAEPRSPSTGCHITGPSFLEESSPCWSSYIQRASIELWQEDTTCRWHHFIPHTHTHTALEALYWVTPALLNSLQGIKDLFIFNWPQPLNIYTSMRNSWLFINLTNMYFFMDL